MLNPLSNETTKSNLPFPSDSLEERPNRTKDVHSNSMGCGYFNLGQKLTSNNMWLQVKDGKITATIQNRPSDAWPRGDDAVWEHDTVLKMKAEYREWLQTFREVEDQISAQNKLPALAITPDIGFGTDIIPGLYRVEAEGEVIKQCRNEDYDEWKDADKFWSNYPFSTRQVIRIKN